MNVLIIKLGATGDVVRTTPLLHRFGKVTWVTAARNRELIEGLEGPGRDLRVLSWEEREAVGGESFDLAISLEDEPETAMLLDQVNCGQVFGAYRDAAKGMAYTDDARRWFDLSLISRHGRERADELKLENRSTYQEMIFDGLGFEFGGEEDLLPPTERSELEGDLAIAPEAGAVWPMKKWAHYDRLRSELESRGLTVNVLPMRSTLLEHLADVRGHRALVCGDSLPMHLALGSGIPTVALFNCTSPWEIHDYGRLTKIVSPRLEKFFYQRGFVEAATTAIPFEEVLEATLAAVAGPVGVQTE